MLNEQLQKLRPRLRPAEPKIRARKLDDGRWCAETTHKGKFVRAYGLIWSDALRNCRKLMARTQ